jgi:hypothetical protein
MEGERPERDPPGELGVLENEACDSRIHTFYQPCDGTCRGLVSSDGLLVV